MIRASRLALSLVFAIGCGGGNDPSKNDGGSEGGTSPSAGGAGALAGLGATGPGLGGAVPGSGGAVPGSGGAAPAAGGCAEPISGARLHLGNFDSRGCNSEGCHIDYSGGWLYTDRYGSAFVADAVITVENPDGSIVSASSATDGFFSLIGNTSDVGKIQVPYVPCVSKCPSTSVCGSKATHTSIDCQTSNCHGAPNQLIYLTTDASGVGGAGGSTGTDCTPPAPGGPRTHTADIYDTQACQICHDDLYTGGFLYDSLAGTNVVGAATVTLTPSGGVARTAVSGPGGMFYFDGLVTAPYDVCVSKCPDKVCAPAGTHTTADDCRTCHNEDLRLHLP